jgi:hypothetical protein
LAKNKVNVKFNGILGKLKRGDLSALLNDKTKDTVGNYTLKNIREFSAKGLSPVRGHGRFAAYAVQRLGGGSVNDKNLYPNSVRGKFPSKGIRPINLRLDGSYISAFAFERIATGVRVGLFDASSLIKKMFEAHNEGMHPDVPQRKVLPTGTDTFVESIIRGIKEIFRERLAQEIKKQNRRG